jgi:translocation-and-assembly-module (TAM) inner membrane subunit TamB-like protein
VTLEDADGLGISQSNLVSYLIFGQPSFELGSESQSYVQLAAQTLVPSAQALGAAQLRNVLGSATDIIQFQPGLPDPTAVGQASGRGKAFTEIFWTSRLGAEKQVTENVFVSLSTGICQFNQPQQNNGTEWLDFYNGLSFKTEIRLSRDASIKLGKEPSAVVCGQRSSGRLVPTPSQYGFSLFKTWRF